MDTKRKSETIFTSKKLWLFINSSFGIWFLTSIVLGTGGIIFKRFYEYKENSRITTEKIRKLDQEIEERIYQFESIAKRQFDSLPNSEQFPAIKEIWFQFKKIPQESYLGFYSIHDEFKGKGITSLIVELSELITDLEEKHELFNLSRLIISDEPITNLKIDDPAKALNQILVKIRMDRWKYDKWTE